VDELHTSRGRQRAGLALLIRQPRDVCHLSELQVVSTPATMASGGSTGGRSVWLPSLRCPRCLGPAGGSTAQ
jgi:ATP-dependent helicase YprA (DUF1998 family)